MDERDAKLVANGETVITFSDLLGKRRAADTTAVVRAESSLPRHPDLADSLRVLSQAGEALKLMRYRQETMVASHDEATRRLEATMSAALKQGRDWEQRALASEQRIRNLELEVQELAARCEEAEHLASEARTWLHRYQVQIKESFGTDPVEACRSPIAEDAPRLAHKENHRAG